jgi:uncharacterized protein (TIGR02598 family)
MRRRRDSGFTLIEVTLAMGVASFAMLAIFGLLPVGLSSNQTSIQQTQAINIATAIVADMTQVPSASAIAASSGTLNAISSQYGINVNVPPSTSSTSTSFYVDGSGVRQSSAAAARYHVSLTLTAMPALTGTTPSRQSTNGMLTLAWPAAAVKPLNQVSVFVALDRN